MTNSPSTIDLVIIGVYFVARSRTLLITADAGVSNGYRLKLWKVQLQKMADKTGLTITVCHFPPAPPGTMDAGARGDELPRR